MSRIAIKICGLSTPETVDAAIKGDAKYVGINFFAPSPRYVSFDRAASLIARMPDRVRPVGIMVDPDDATIEQAIAAGIRTIQLHGTETPKKVAAIRARHNVPIWKVISVKTRADLDTGTGYAGISDFLLYDAKTPGGSALPGGMGLRFDWGLLAGFEPPMAWGLSGGLDASNVAEAIRVTGAPLVDVSSGVENAPGIKDVDKIAAFCEAVRLS